MKIKKRAFVTAYMASYMAQARQRYEGGPGMLGAEEMMAGEAENAVNGAEQDWNHLRRYADENGDHMVTDIEFES